MGYTITEEERKRRSERAKRMHAEGKLNAKRDGAKGGAARSKRLSQEIREKMADDAEVIYKRLKKVIQTGSDREAVNAIKLALDIGWQEDKIEREEVRELEQLEQNELLAYIAEGLRELSEAGELGDWDVIDADEVEPARAIGPGPSDRGEAEAA